MPVRQLGRRHFLMGTGGAVLSIPFLSSLQPRTAKAQSYDQRFFVAYLTGHGGVWPEHMYPGSNVLNNSHSLYSDHTMRYGRLSAAASGGNVALSPVLTSAAASMPQSLAKNYFFPSLSHRYRENLSRVLAVLAFDVAGNHPGFALNPGK